MPDSPADRLSGHFPKPVLFRDLFRDIAICGCSSVWDLKKNPPYLLPEPRAYRVERRGEVRLSAVKIDIEPADSLGKYQSIRLGMFLRKILRVIFLTVKPQTGQSDLVRGKQNAAERRYVMLGIYHFSTSKYGFIPAARSSRRSDMYRDIGIPRAFLKNKLR